MIYEINFIYLKQTKVGPLSYLSTQNGVALCDCVTHINELAVIVKRHDINTN
jgi:hypothetical protein